MRVFFHAKPSPAVRPLQRLVECLGIECECVDVGSAGNRASAAQAAAGQEKAAIVLDADSLKRHPDLNELAEWATQAHASLLVLASEPDDLMDRFLKMLTHGAVGGVVAFERARRAGFATVFSQELAGHSFAREAVETLSLQLAASGRSEIIMTLDQAPAFVRVAAGNANIFVWATKTVFDMSRPLAAEKEFELAPDQYIPAMIFLRSAFGDRCWRNPSPGAGLVIDDPLLQKNYGFINFSQLLESARKHEYHVTLAFIPWNHWRSHAARTRMFIDHADCFSVCVHGCDHTNREFGSANYDDLLGRNFVALGRMEQHRQRTGLACEPLMVCPQEQYSIEAMRAFADSRQFLGLICTACQPRNLTAPGICGADLLLPAQDSFFGVPVFKRHYWSDISVFAMALFLGKPAILVEHHEFFRAGPGGAESFVSQLKKVRPAIQWTSLVETATHTHLRRRLSPDAHEVRFFTDDFKLEHAGAGPMAYRLVRRVPPATRVQKVTVDGAETSFVQREGWLRFGLQADTAHCFHVRVEVPPIRPAQTYSHGLKYHASVAFRRGLSEFRDNVMARNDFVLRSARRLAKTMKQTGN